MFVLWCRWRYGGENPYVLYHGSNAKASPHPERIQALLDAFALYAHEADAKLAGAKTGTR